MNKNSCELVFVLDKSSSMSGLENDTIGGFNANLEAHRKLGGEARVTTVLFDNKYELLHDRIDIRAITPMTYKEYKVGWGTALLDAVGETIRKIRNVQKQTAEEFRAEKVIFVIITDGQENSSRKYNYTDIKKLIEHQQKKHGWEFLFLGANIDAFAEADKLGIPLDHSYKYTADSAGLRDAYEVSACSSALLRQGKTFKMSEYLSGTEQTLSNDEKKETESTDDIANLAAENLIRKMEADKNMAINLNDVLQYYSKKNYSDSIETLRKHLGNDIQFTGNWSDPGDLRELNDEELLTGEISAVTYTVGCYTVRDAQRIYHGYTGFDDEEPCNGEMIAHLRSLEDGGRWFLYWDSSHNLRVTNEISAKHNSDRNGAFTEGYKYICRASYAKMGIWRESIHFIGAIKKNASLPDEQASLFVNNFWMGDSHSNDQWSKLAPNGIITKKLLW